MDYKYEESTLENGLRVVTIYNSNLDIFSAELLIRAGSRFETNNEQGYAHILEHMLLKGTKNRPSPVELRKEIDKLGIKLNAFTSREYVKFYFKSINKNSDTVFELMSDIVLNSILDEEILFKEKKVIIEELEGYLNDPWKSTVLKSLGNFFNNHPLSSHPLGNRDSIEAVSRSKLKSYFDNFYNPSNSILIVSGGVSHKETLGLLDSYLKEWTNNEDKSSFDEIEPYIPGKKNLFIKKYLNKYLFYINFKTLNSPKKKELAALDILSNYLTTGSSSYLLNKLRNEKGLVYFINSKNRIYTDFGRFSIMTSSTKPEEVLNILKDSLNNLSSILTEGDFKDSKIKTKNSFIMNSFDPSFLTDFTGEKLILFNNLIRKDEYLSIINNVSFDEIKKIIEKYFFEENMFVTISGPDNLLEK